MGQHIASVATFRSRAGTLRRRRWLMPVVIVMTATIGGCGRQEPPPGGQAQPDRGVPEETTPATGPVSPPTASSVPSATAPAAPVDPNVLSGSYRVAAVELKLASDAVRFPDKAPGATHTDPAVVQPMRRALAGSRWRFDPTGAATMTWTDPVLNSEVELTGRWQLLFGRFDVSVANRVVTIQRPDGSPNAPASLRGGLSRIDGGNGLLYQASLFHAGPDGRRVTGQCELTLVPQ
jgi:hypothetical protein